MEKKTIGGFISALRKANGLTQKQLAEKLNVSDKAVSRWERDEAMPDLSLIPVLAEIFGVTSDEILRGERYNPISSSVKSEDKAEKQRKRILADKKTKYKVRSTISMGIAALGLIAAMICNFGFMRAYIGFMVGTAFYTAAAVCQVIFLILNLSGLDEDLLTEDELAQHRNHTVKLANITFSTIITLIAASLPLVTIPWDTYQGLNADAWLLYGLIYALIGLIACFVICCILNLLLVKQGLVTMAAKKLALQKLRLRFTGVFALAMIVLFIIQRLLNAGLPDLFMTGTEFNDWDSFKSLMETLVEANNGDIAYSSPISSGLEFSTNYEPIDESVPTNKENVVYHDDGSVSYFPGYSTHSITADDGTVLCEFQLRNESVYSWKYELTEDNPVITVYTVDDVREANLIVSDLVNPIYGLLYPIGAMVLFLIYRKKARMIQ